MVTAKQLKYILAVAILCLLPVVFSFKLINFNVFELPKQAVFHVLLWSLLALSLNTAMLKGRLTAPAGRIRLALLVLIGAWLIGGWLLSAWPEHSFWGNYFRVQGVFTYLLYLLWFYLLLAADFGLAEWRKLSAWLAASSLPVAVYGVVQFSGLDPLVWSANTTRLFSTFGQPNFLAHYLVMVLPWLWYQLNLSKLLWQRLAWWALGWLDVFVLIFSLSRSGWLAFLASAGLWLLLWLWLERAWRRRLYLLLATGALTVAVLIWQAPRLSTQPCCQNFLAKRFLSSFVISEGGGSIRKLYWQAVVQDFKTTTWRHRLFGYGKDNQDLVFAGYYNADWSIFEHLDSFPDRAHNWLLDGWLEFGLVGLLAAAAFWLLVIRAAWRMLSAGDEQRQLALAALSSLLAYAVAASFGFGLTAHFVGLWFIAALLVSVSGQTKSLVVPVRADRYFRWTLLGALALAAGLCFYLFDIRYLIADRYFLQAKQAKERLDFRTLIDKSQLMQTSFDWQPYFNDLYLFFMSNALVAVDSQESLQAAEHNIGLVLAQMPAAQFNSFFSLLNRARSYASLGRHLRPEYYQLARQDFQRLLALTPGIAVTYQDYGRMELWSGDAKAARAIYQQGLARLPDLADPRFAVGYGSEVVKGQYFTFYNLMCDTYIQEQAWSEANDWCRRAYELAPDSGDNLEDLTEIYRRQHRYREALKYATRARIANPAEHKWSLVVAELYFDAGDYERSMLFAREAVRREADNQQATALLKRLQQLKTK